MTTSPPPPCLRHGAILLDEAISCDGFVHTAPVRAQTHIHMDHMLDFNTSKANQEILVSPATHSLLCAIYDADLPLRENLIALPPGSTYPVNDSAVQLIDSDHMLGSCQVALRRPDGTSIGYSSDFFWPMEAPMSVDELIVDATYGDPLRQRLFGQGEVDERLAEIVYRTIRSGRPMTLLGHVGRLHVALASVCPTLPVPVVASPRAAAPIAVYRDHGYALPPVIDAGSPEAIALIRSREPFLGLVTLPERRHVPWVSRFPKLTLSAHMANRTDPVTDYGNGDYCVALTDHADFEGTLQYIQATGAQRVWTDPRSGNAAALAEAVRNHLGLWASELYQVQTLEWG